MKRVPSKTTGVTRRVADISIEPVMESDWDEFFRYLNHLRRDNGLSAGSYFLPISRSESAQPYPKEDSFRVGLHVPVGAEGWRRAWVMRSGGQIVAQVDLRAHPVPFAEHRCLLGLGVHRKHRRRGLGAALLAHAEEWAAAIPQLEWIDLEVLSANEPALRLYRRAGFAEVGKVAEMFKLDGRLFSLTRMARRILR